ncbi:bifunctional serine/threonine-protein kinase/formylglycine-generating enzyme family protein [Lysobacter enzymogenes]|uniref:bifunctional serine/threonine-protein kinase/formylglycine-generating enzyme family protein n=1 Tax=Lysobacter enzymogenes TaxID=69 RepID=UPI00099B967A|nr:serine/threonine-protein kinase [Lysobacter enzymogenes]UZW58404.1 serine/threonine protein kinase [Lysobacter enzymogenes]
MKHTDERPRAADSDDATRVAPIRADAGATAASPADAPAADETVVAPMRASATGAPAAHTHTPATDAPPAAAPAPDAAPHADDATVVKRPAIDTERRRATSQSTSAGTTDWVALSADPAQAQVGVGTLLKGRFLLEREIGRGGMGVVYLARDERKVEARDRHPHIAVKVLNDDFRRHPDALIALQREARKAQSLAHDRIVRVYDFDKDGTVVFMTMEYIDGTDLRGLIRGRQGQGLPMAEAAGLIEGMGRALERAHRAGVVHSDFKPGNVMVDADGAAKVFDFGIARATRRVGEADDDRTVFDATTLGALTPAYASLEMLRGEQPAVADDVYAFGCVVYELLAGRHPFDKLSAQDAQAAGKYPKPIRGLSRRQNRALQRCLAFAAADRPGIAEVLEQLRPRGLRERARGYAVGAGALLLGGAAAAFLAQAYSRQQQSRQVLQRLAPGAADRYADEAQAGRALMALDEEDRRRLVADASAPIESFLLARIDHYWLPYRGREDYAGAQRVLAVREQLKLFSPRLETRRIELEQERNKILNELDTRLSRAIAAGALFEDQPGNAVAILGRIRAIDPNSRLLRHAQLALSYDAAIVQAIGGGQLESARVRLARARQVFPNDPNWPVREQQLTAAVAAPPVPAEGVPVAGAPAEGAPDATAPLAEPAAMEAAEPLAQAEEAAMREAEIETRIESLRGAAAASDADKVADLLRRIGQLDPAHAFLGEGRRLLRDTVLGEARDLSRQGKWSDAAELCARRDDWSGDPAVRQAGLRYALAADLVRQDAIEPGAAAWPGLQGRARKLRAQDPRGLRLWQAELAGSNRRSAIAVRGLLQRLLAAPVEPAPAPAATTTAAPDTPAVADRADKKPEPLAACRAGAAAKARPCGDSLGSYGNGPVLVVVPRAGKKPLAIMRREIGFDDLKPFCDATRSCPDSSRWQGKTVARDLPLSLVQKYAQWLSGASRQAYRLPTDAEWIEAARAGGAEAVCEVAVTNRWGLVNMAGGVGEWVVDGSVVGVRGGPGNARACAGAAGVGNGRADARIGARLVKELK